MTKQNTQENSLLLSVDAVDEEDTVAKAEAKATHTRNTHQKQQHSASKPPQAPRNDSIASMLRNSQSYNKGDQKAMASAENSSNRQVHRTQTQQIANF